MQNYRPKKGAPRNTTEHRGTLRSLADRLNLVIPHWNPPYFAGFLPNSLILLAPDAPFPNTEIGKAAECEITDQNQVARRNTAESRGTLRGLTESLNLDNPRWIPPYFGGVLPNSLKIVAPDAPLPTPKWARRRNAKLPTKQSDTAGRH